MQKNYTLPYLPDRTREVVDSEKLRAVSREVRYQKFIFFRIKLKVEDMVYYQYKYLGNIFFTWISKE